MTSPQISIRNVSVQFPGVLALDGVSLDIPTGELHAIAGENGAGKSTLMKLLAGVYTRYSGEILLGGLPVQFRSTRDAERAGVSIIHQELNLVDELSVAANIFLGRERHGFLGWLDDRAMNAEAGRLLADLECQALPTQPVGGLRVGDQQLVEIAKALSLQAQIVIMDEPTSALTETETERLMRIINRLRDRGVTILYISHKMDEIFRLADRITVLRDGRLVRTVEARHSSPREVAHLMVGREIQQGASAAVRSPGPVVLETRGLTQAWPGHAQQYRLRDVSLQVHAGEVVGLAGLMGAGRTELLECLYGAGRPSPSGEILLDGQSVQFRHPAEALAAGLALVTEDRKRLGLFEQFSVGQNITLCALRDSVRLGLVSFRQEQTQAGEMIDKLRVKTPGFDSAITNLSGGNQQKCLIARGLLTEPRLLLLDDPTRGVDVGAKAELYQLIDELCRMGMAVLVTSSELPELLTLSDRIYVLCEGRLTGHFVRAEATEQRIMEAATARQAAGRGQSSPPDSTSLFPLPADRGGAGRLGTGETTRL